MYRSTSEKMSFLRRVASHATKPYRNGRIAMIPASAEKVEANSPLRQYSTLLKNISDANSRGDKNAALVLGSHLKALSFHPEVSAVLKQHQKIDRDVARKEAEVRQRAKLRELFNKTLHIRM
jgi:hypothetical protein